MGFSVSGSFVLLLFAAFIALGSLYASGANTMERLSAAGADRTERVDRLATTDVALGTVDLAGTCGVEFNVTNTGSTELRLADTDLLLDNGYETGWQSGATVDGDGDTDLWLPGENLTITRTGLSAAPDRVQVVTGPGVAAARSTEGLVC